MSKTLAEERMLTARDALMGPYPQPAGHEPGGLPFRRVLASMFRARWFVAGTMTLGCCVGLFLAVTTPNTYLSEGSFLFTASGSESINVDLTRSSENKAEAVAANAVHVLQADQLLRRVAERVTPEEILRPYQPDDRFAGGFSRLLHSIQRDWNAVDVVGATVDSALKVMRKRLLVERSRLGDVLTVTYSAHDAELAQKVLAVYMEEAKKWHQEQYDDPKVYEEAQKRAEEAAKARNLATRNLREFLEREAHVQNPFEFELEQLRAADATAATELKANQVAIQDAQTQIAELERRLATLAPTTTVRRRLPTTKTVEGIQDEISKLEIARTRVMVESAQGSDLKAIDDKIQKLRLRVQQIAEDAKSAPEYDLQEENAEWAEATRRLGALRTQVTLDQSTTPRLQKSKGDLSGRLRKLLDLEPKYVELRDALARADEDVRSTAEARSKAELKRQLQLGNFSSLKVIDTASLPLDKEGPNRMKLIFGGLCLGLFAGLGLVLARTVPDRTVRTPDDLEGLEGTVVIGVLPRFDGKNMRRHQATRMRGW